MHTAFDLFCAAAAAVLSASVLGSPALAQDAPSGNAAEGKRIYSAVGCYYCHGHSGQGGFMNTPAPTLAKTEMPWEGFLGQLRHPINDMPAYAESVLPEKQAADIYAFLQSLPGPRTDAKDLPVFKK